MILVHFYETVIQNNFKSEAAGRPIFEPAVFIRKLVPGDRTLMIDRKMRESDKTEFPAEWARYQQQANPAEVGTPLKEWPTISRSQAMELSAVNVNTVEALAGISDTHISQINMMGLQTLRTKAQAWLQASAGAADVQSQAAEIGRLNQELTDLREMVTGLNVAPEPGETGRKRGRPKSSRSMAKTGTDG